MDLTPYVDNLRHELGAAAATGGEEARELAERLTAPLESAARLTVLNALSAAMDEVTCELAPASLHVRMRGLDPEFVVTPGPFTPTGVRTPTPTPTPAPVRVPVRVPVPVPARVSADGHDAATARVNLRLPAHLKTRVEEASGHEGLSANTWFVRAVTAAL